MSKKKDVAIPLPKTLYVKMEQDGTEIYPLTYDKAIDAVDGDTPARVGTYQLVEINTYRKTVEVVK